MQVHSKDTPELRKERGAFFTPPPISRFICNWAITEPDATVLEPSCGEASFLQSAGERLRALRRQGVLFDGSLRGVELHPESARSARDLLRQAGLSAKIEVGDFFDFDPEPRYKAVIGNPPYVRFQQFTGEMRAKALRTALTQGVKLTRLASSWAAFAIHASRFLTPDGRLGLVLPAELLTVNYAAPVRRFLLRRFAKVRLVMFEELVFPGVLEEVVLLLAEGSGGCDRFEVYQAESAEDLQNIKGEGWSGFSPKGEGKWTAALLSENSFDLYQRLTSGDSFSRLIEWGTTSLGAVTGANRYFTLTAEEVRKRRIPKSALLRISPPGSRHLRGLTFSDGAWDSASKGGASCYLFYPQKDRFGSAVKNYIEEGEAAGVHKAYKCRVRTPWWRVPVVSTPDIFLTYMDRDRPRFVRNAAGVSHLNSLYGVNLKREHRQLGRDLLPIAALNSVTLLGSEMAGRSYGGGMLKVEPNEADLIPLPSPQTVDGVEKQLRALRPQLGKWLRRGDLIQAVRRVDEVLLTEHLQVPDLDLEALRQARELLFSRRTTRGKGARGKG